jgi:hypothetical protein
VTTVVAVLGWVIGHRFNANRDRDNKRRELRTKYLIDAYRVICARCRVVGKDPTLAKPIEEALTDIQLFGSPEQITLARDFALAEHRHEIIDMSPLLNSLRRDLRSELGLEPIGGKIWQLHYMNKPAEPDGKLGPNPLP